MRIIQTEVIAFMKNAVFVIHEHGLEYTIDPVSFSYVESRIANIDRKVKAKLGSYSRGVIEGSPEWDVLYRKTFDEEMRKHVRG